MKTSNGKSLEQYKSNVGEISEKNTLMKYTSQISFLNNFNTLNE